MRTWSAVLGIPVFLVIMLAVIADSGVEAQSPPAGSPGVTVTPEVRPIPSPEPTAVPPSPTPTPVPHSGGGGASGASTDTSTPAFNITYTYGDGAIHLDWDDIPGAMGYEIHQWDGGTGWNRLPFTDGSGNSFTVTFDGSSATIGGVTNGIGYSQYVVAKNVNGQGDVWSPTWIETKVVVLDPPAPTNLRIVSTTTDHRVTVAWDAIEDIADYRVEAIWIESTSSAWLAYERIVTSTQVSFEPLWCNSNFRIAVSPRGDGFPYKAAFSSHSIILYDTPYCPPVSAPGNFRTATTTSSSIHVIWDATEHVSEYHVWTQALPGGEWNLSALMDGGLYYGNPAGIDLHPLACGTAYNFAIQSFGDGINYQNLGSSFVFTTSTTEGCPRVSAPSNLRVTSTSTGSVGLSWDAETDASQYKVEYALAPVGTSTAVWRVSTESATSTSALVSGLLCDEEYRFTVSSAGDGVSHSADFGSPSVVMSARTGRCPVYAPFVIAVDPEYPHANATTTLSFPDHNATYQWQEWTNESWSDLGATTTLLDKIVSSSSAVTRKFRVVGTSGRQTFESPVAYVTWDISNVTLDFLDKVSDRVHTSTGYALSETRLLNCLNRGVSTSSRRLSFDGVLANYTGGVKGRMEPGGLCNGESARMFSEYKRLVRTAVRELETSTSEFHLFLKSEEGEFTKGQIGNGDRLRRLAGYASGPLPSAGTLASPLYVATSTSEGGPRGSHGKRDVTNPPGEPRPTGLGTGLNCLPTGIQGEPLTIENKMIVLNCLVFATPHSFWMKEARLLHTNSTSTLRDHPRFRDWLESDDWECTDPAFDGPMPACLKHDFAFNGLQRFAGEAGSDNWGDELDATWNPKNKALADLRFAADILKYGCQYASALAREGVCGRSNKVLAELYYGGVAKWNDKGWPYINDDLRGFSSEISGFVSQVSLLDRSDEKFEICPGDVFPDVRWEGLNVAGDKITALLTFVPGCTAGLSDVAMTARWSVHADGLFWGRDYEQDRDCSTTNFGGGNVVVACSFGFIGWDAGDKVTGLAVFIKPENKLFGSDKYRRRPVEVSYVIPNHWRNPR